MARTTERATKAREMHAAGESNQAIKDALGYKSVGAVYAVVNGYTSPNRANGNGGTGGSWTSLMARAGAKRAAAEKNREKANTLADRAADLDAEANELELKAETADQRAAEREAKQALKAAAKREKLAEQSQKAKDQLAKLQAKMAELEAATNRINQSLAANGE